MGPNQYTAPAAGIGAWATQVVAGYSTSAEKFLEYLLDQADEGQGLDISFEDSDCSGIGDHDDWAMSVLASAPGPLPGDFPAYLTMDPRELQVPKRHHQRVTMWLEEPLPAGNYMFSMGRSGVGGEEVTAVCPSVMFHNLWLQSDGSLRSFQVYATNAGDDALELPPASRAGIVKPVDQVVPFSEKSWDSWADLHAGEPTAFKCLTQQGTTGAMGAPNT